VETTFPNRKTRALRIRRSLRTISSLTLHAVDVRERDNLERPAAGGPEPAAGGGDYDRAKRIAWSIITSKVRPLALALAAGGDYDRAAEIARSSSSPHEQAQVLSSVAAAAAVGGDYRRARELTVDAERITRFISVGRAQAEVLAGVAVAAAVGGDYDRAEEIARSISPWHEQVEVLADVAVAAAVGGDYDRAERIASSAIFPSGQARVLAGVAVAAAVGGDYDRAERIARPIITSQAQARALALALAVSGDYDRAEKVARSSPRWDEQLESLADLAVAAAGGGNHDRARKLTADAERIARSITLPLFRARALADVACRATEPTRARSCIAGALAAHDWAISLRALARIDPAALSAFADELALGPSQTRDNGPLSGTPARHDAGRPGNLIRRELRDSRTLSGTSTSGTAEAAWRDSRRARRWP
jgi:tetratricopeptide (TPR) repeat protein